MTDGGHQGTESFQGHKFIIENDSFLGGRHNGYAESENWI